MLIEVAVGKGSHTLAIDRIMFGRCWSQLNHWPKAYALRLAGHGTPLVKTFVERGEPRTRSPSLSPATL